MHSIGTPTSVTTLPQKAVSQIRKSHLSRDRRDWLMEKFQSTRKKENPQRGKFWYRKQSSEGKSYRCAWSHVFRSFSANCCIPEIKRGKYGTAPILHRSSDDEYRCTIHTEPHRLPISLYRCEDPTTPIKPSVHRQVLPASPGAWLLSQYGCFAHQFLTLGFSSFHHQKPYSVCGRVAASNLVSFWEVVTSTAQRPYRRFISRNDGHWFLYRKLAKNWSIKKGLALSTY